MSNKVDELLKNQYAVVTPLLHSLITEDKDLSGIPAIKWGIQHEKDAVEVLVK